MIRSYSFDTDKDGVEGIDLLLFAVRESVQGSLGFSQFDLVFGHTVRVPLKLLNEKFLSDDVSSACVKNRLSKTWEASQPNLKSAKRKMKMHYDEMLRIEILNLETRYIPCKPLQARYYGPYTVD